MSDPYLILHKVRGEPAFDIAERMRMQGDTFWWIIPTSGHRAYPLIWWMLEDLADVSDINRDGYHERPITKDHTVFPEGFPDHYSSTRGINVHILRPIEKAEFSIDDL